MIDQGKKQAYERAEVRFRQICLEDPLVSPHRAWRFMRKRDLHLLIRGILDDVRNAGQIARSAIPGVKPVVQELLQRDLLREVGEPFKDKEAYRIYWLTLRGGRAGGHNEFELVSSLDRAGVVSHFSALVFHDLTDIRATDHFLTSPKTRPKRHKPNPAEVNDQVVPSNGGARRSEGPKIGTRCFSNEGVTYRLRQSIPENIFDVSQPWVDDNERIRVFGLERAMLDAVNDPACNGGMRGVIEAWEKGAERIREERLLGHLHRFNRDSLWRRVGALADLVGRKDVSERVCKAVLSESWIDEPLPLIWHQTVGSIVKPWNVVVPW